MEPATPEPENKKLLSPEEELHQRVRRKTIKAFAWFGAALAAQAGIWKWIISQPKESGAKRPLRKMLEVNEKIAGTYFSHGRTAPTFPKAMAAANPRVNGKVGLRDASFDAGKWKLSVENVVPVNGRRRIELTIDDIKSLPKHEIVFEFKCIEGWSQMMHWGGAKFSDFVIKYHLGTRSGNLFDEKNPDDLVTWVGMQTPDKQYYVGIDMPSALHPQTLLAYELNGKPISLEHGAPLRLIIPAKYGVKNLKRIGTIQFTDTRPPDYWAERGYDYHVGL